MLAAFRTVVFILGIVCLFFLGVVRASDKNIHICFSFLYFLWNSFFVVAKIIGSHGKMIAYFSFKILLSVVMTTAIQNSLLDTNHSTMFTLLLEFNLICG